MSSKQIYSFVLAPILGRLSRSTDSGKVEQELIVVLSFTKDDMVEEIQSHARFITPCSPESADARRLVKCLSQGLSPIACGCNLLERASVLGNDTKLALVGGGTDGVIKC